MNALKRRCAVKLYTDSKYVLAGHHRVAAELEGARLEARRRVRRSRTRILWQQLDVDLAAWPRKTWSGIWVKGHSGHEGNDYVDQLANVAIDRMLAGQ